ncbi:MAG: hypothetical protein ACXAE3_09460 [Candidatus Kariarchaeaceae archaeon]|jgi:hypothetical protein
MPHDLHPSEINQKMIDIAKQNGIITADEQAIIESVKENIAKYFEVLHQSYDDDIITSDEQNDMYALRKRIMDEAVEIAKDDNQITQDEFALLRVIKSILEEMEYNEHY